MRGVEAATNRPSRILRRVRFSTPRAPPCVVSVAVTQRDSARLGFPSVVKIQRPIDISDCERSLPDHGRQITESESKAEDAAKSESQHRDSEKEHGLSRQSRTEKEVEEGCKAATNLPSPGRSRPAPSLPDRRRRLRQGVTHACLNLPDVRRRNRPANFHVFAEVAAGHSDADLTPRLCYVGALYGFVPIDITDEHLRAH